MFDIGWSEMLVLAVVTILVVGPRDLPRMLRTVGQFVGKARRMAGEFQRQFNDALKEAELDDVKKSIDSARNAIPKNPIKESLESMAKAGSDVKAAVEKPVKPASADPASSEAQPAEPIKSSGTSKSGASAKKQNADPEPSATSGGNE
ncbi:MAG: twin-arginine translocase subunit TatB [Rhodobiaceae bacterium]|nr:twin-arginine translocase subunit TatB [Rhodobiaceae bacterium]MCC0018875.1 twin-arginine translocase subunit TatB [Rhodobiaceae bacterium]MCC0051694.1 twin-arginine translocase subunit TatB [Rhodobiaceae bacterium]MCC0060730.1 twin-arginine translocase subunit TatB [Rhodobiaceae bacterium]